MRKKITAFFLIMVFVVLSFCGCDSVTLSSVEKLMKPPAAYKVDTEIKEAFEKYVSSQENLKGVTLLSPSSGDYRSAFVMHDIDLDGEKEALVFYASKHEASRVHMNVLDNINGTWTTVNDFSVPGNNINFVRFVQMTHGNCPAIIVSHNIYESATNNAISVYVCDNTKTKNKITNICSELYSVMENIDMDNDGALDLFLIQQDFSDTNLPRAYASVFKMTEKNELNKIGSTKLDGTISAYVGVKAEKVNSSSPMRIYVDAIKGEQQMITEVIYWNSISNSLVTPMFDSDTQSNIKTRREEELRSQDFDADGVIEIPSQREFEGSKKYLSAQDVFQQMYITDWIEVKNETEYTVTSTIVNARDSYLVNYNDMKELIGDFTVYDYSNKKTWTFKEYNPLTHKPGKELFSITSIAKAETQAKNIDKGSYIMEDDVFLLYFTLTQDGIKKNITAQKVADCIKTFKE